jgi:hypothetical protein
MMTNQIPGVPEGWELVHANRFADPGEFILTEEGNPYMASTGSARPFPIIRKIEKPAKYRPFANAREADQFWNASLRIANSIPESKDSRFRINTIGCDGITIGLEFYSYKAAFDGFNVDDDGTPFGVKIDE